MEAQRDGTRYDSPDEALDPWIGGRGRAGWNRGVSPVIRDLRMPGAGGVGRDRKEDRGEHQ